MYKNKINFIIILLAVTFAAGFFCSSIFAEDSVDVNKIYNNQEKKNVANNINKMKDMSPIPVTDDIWLLGVEANGSKITIKYNFPRISGAVIGNSNDKERKWLYDNLKSITIKNVCAGRHGIYSLVYKGFNIEVEYYGVETFIFKTTVNDEMCLM